MPNYLIRESMADEKLLPVFASSDIKVYLFQFAAATLHIVPLINIVLPFATNPAWGKSHEAMTILITTYDFLSDQAAAASPVHRDLTV